MKKFFNIALVILSVAMLASCNVNSDNKTENNKDTTAASENDNESFYEDTTYTGNTVDLTKLSATVLYSELYNMITQPDDFIGKTVKMRGTYAVYNGEKRNYYVCEIQDSTACCTQGLEFILKDGEEYPEYNSESPVHIEIKGTFNTYKEDGQTYVQLENASYRYCLS